jgi:peptidoglycan-associated lipoprotein
MFAAGLLFVSGIGCTKRPPPLPPPPVADRPGPGTTDVPSDRELSLELWVEPSRIQAGESALLRWETQGAASVRIDPNIGEVDLSGRIRFFPDTTTTYSVTAESPAGRRMTKSVTVEVLTGNPDSPDVRDLRASAPGEGFEANVRPVFFAFDDTALSEEARLTLDGNIRWLQLPQNRGLRFVIQGHTDERGSEEYNLALGDSRAQVVKQYLIANGIDSARIMAVSLGEERPFARGDSEEAHALNRRAHFVLPDPSAHP